MGTVFADNGAAISPGLAEAVANKAFRLRIATNNRRTGEENDPDVGQVGLIRGNRLTASPPTQKQATGDGPRPVPALRVSRFEAIPTTCFHNVVSEEDEDGDMADYCFSTIIAPTGNQIRITSFARGGEELSLQDAVVIRPAADANGEGRLDWNYGHDVTQAAAVINPESYFTKTDCSYERVQRQDYRFQVGQKIGISVYRNFTVTCGDVGIPPNSKTEDELRNIYGREDRVNIYTGEITRVSEDMSLFEHNINTFRGCAGALVFLLDQHQTGYDVRPDEQGKAIAVHAGGKYIGSGQRINIAFAIP